MFFGLWTWVIKCKQLLFKLCQNIIDLSLGSISNPILRLFKAWLELLILRNIESYFWVYWCHFFHFSTFSDLHLPLLLLYEALFGLFGFFTISLLLTLFSTKLLLFLFLFTSSCFLFLIKRAIAKHFFRVRRWLLRSLLAFSRKAVTDETSFFASPLLARRFLWIVNVSIHLIRLDVAFWLSSRYGLLRRWWRLFATYTNLISSMIVISLFFFRLSLGFPPLFFGSGNILELIAILYLFLFAFTTFLHLSVLFWLLCFYFMFYVILWLFWNLWLFLSIGRLHFFVLLLLLSNLSTVRTIIRFWTLAFITTTATTTAAIAALRVTRWRRWIRLRSNWNVFRVFASFRYLRICTLRCFIIFTHFSFSFFFVIWVINTIKWSFLLWLVEKFSGSVYKKLIEVNLGAYFINFLSDFFV